MQIVPQLWRGVRSSCVRVEVEGPWGTQSKPHALNMENMAPQGSIESMANRFGVATEG